MKLQTKFLSLLLPAALLAAGFVLVLIRRAVDTVVIGGLERNAIVLGKAVALDAARGMASGREMEVLPHLQALKQLKSALYASAIDSRGRIVAHTTLREKGRIDDGPAVRNALRTGEPATRRGRIGTEPVLFVVVPVWAPAAGAGGEEYLLSRGPRRRLGAIKLAVPLGEALDTVMNIIRAIALIVLAAGAVVFGLVVALLRGMLAPIRGLMAGIARIGGGQYDVEVPVRSRDEIGELARSFNTMSGELARTTVSKEYVESVLDNMYDLLVVADGDGRIRTVNHAAAEALGDGELIGRPLVELFEGRPTPGVVRDAEVVLRTKGGGRITALYSASPLLDRQGRPRGYIGVAKDITQRKRDEKALLAAKLAAEASARELGAFSYSVAHDLRAPLRAVDGFSQILLEQYSDRLDETGKDYLRRVRGGSGKMGRLIDDLLDLSRITRGVLMVGTVDLSALARDIADELCLAEPARAVEFIIAPGLTAQGDAGLMRVALANLLGNSWKYTSKHAGARIEFGAQPRGGRTVYFVRDDGAGFDMKFVGRLFQPFTRLHASAEFEGTGIGLALVERVIGRHEGAVWGEGEVERGAVFYFTLWEGKQ